MKSRAGGPAAGAARVGAVLLFALLFLVSFEVIYAVAGEEWLESQLGDPESIAFGVSGTSGATPPKKVGADGETEIPGTGGKKVKWKITAKKTGPKKLQIWMDVTNNNPGEVKFVLCSMVNLKKPDVVHEFWHIEPDGMGGYKCVKDNPQPTAPDNKWPPSYHLGCKEVTVPGGGMSQPFDETVCLSEDFNPDEIESNYFDILKAGTPPPGNCVTGPNKFLYPMGGVTTDWANIWGGGTGPTPLTSRASVSSPVFPSDFRTSWPVGNWVTMGYAGPFPARMEATLRGAPAGSTVQLVTAGVTGPSFVVPQRPGGSLCDGGDLLMVDSFSITNRPASTEMYLQLPAGACGEIEEGRRMQVFGNVYATAPSAWYAPDSFMYGIYYEIFNDTQPPEILAVTTSQEGKALRVNVAASDGQTMPAGATFLWRDARGRTGEEPINFANPAMEGKVVFFSDRVPGLPMDMDVDCQIRVIDEVGNATVSTVTKVRLEARASERPRGTDPVTPREPRERPRPGRDDDQP